MMEQREREREREGDVRTTIQPGSATATVEAAITAPPSQSMAGYKISPQRVALGSSQPLENEIWVW